MPASPPARESNAIWRPSGDHLGEPVNGPLNDVTATGSEPSAPLIQISGDPERVDSKASLRPSGENAGFACQQRLQETSLSAGPLDRIGLASVALQMFTLTTVSA